MARTYTKKTASEKIFNKMSKQLINEGLQFIDEVFNNSIDITIREARMLYEKYIDDYYSYVTTSYYRHGTGKGSGSGSNLYMADMMRFNGKKIIIEVEGRDMAPYRKVSTNHVLDMVIHGERPMGTIEGKAINIVGWEGSYSGAYFSSKATLYNALDDFFGNGREILNKVAKQEIARIKASGKYKYFRRR